jgi:hypothetical protein
MIMTGRERSYRMRHEGTKTTGDARRLSRCHTAHRSLATASLSQLDVTELTHQKYINLSLGWSRAGLWPASRLV